LRRQTAVALAGVAAEAEGLQVADGVGAALVFGDDVVHLQGPLVLAEGIEALAAELQQRVALGIAQLVAADQAVVAIAIGGDAVEGEPGPAWAAQDPPGHVVLGGGGMGESWLG
jgi:hypothetical protein